MTGQSIRLTTLGVVAGLLTGCAANAPVVMPMNYPAEAAPTASTSGSKSHVGAICLVRIAEVRDQRTDPHILGDTMNQPVRVEDSGEWIRSALKSLDGESGLKFVDQPTSDAGELVLNVELLKAYTMYLATDRAATVVIKVKYSRRGMPIDEQIYRGAENTLNWSNGADETRGSLNTALGRLLRPFHEDVLHRCLAR